MTVPSAVDDAAATTATTATASDRPAKQLKTAHNADSMTPAAPPTSSALTTTLRLLVRRDPAYPLAKLPTRGSASAAGYDLYASEKLTIPKGARKVVQTGISLAIPEGHYGRVAPRSGLASKHGIDVGAGVIDSDYRGLLGVLLFNLGDSDFVVNEGDRIAQLIVERISTPPVEEVDDLDETIRGAGGFGSTGGFGSVAAADPPTETEATS